MGRHQLILVLCCFPALAQPPTFTPRGISPCTNVGGNFACPGSLTSGVGTGVAGTLDLGQGTLPSTYPANTFSLYAPTAISLSYQWIVPSADPGQGFLFSNGGATPSLLTTKPYVAIDLTGQTAAKTSTLLLAPTATAAYRITYYAKVTTVASVSSILGGTTGLVITFTDGTDSVAQTAFTLPEVNQAGTSLAIGTGNVTNTTQATLTGTALIFAKTGVNINYAFGYQSTNAAEMAYELHIRLEGL